MTEQPTYKLYAIRTADLPKDGLKGFEYSLQANGRYALVFTQTELKEPYRAIADSVKLEKDEADWLMRCKTEINARYLRENETEYAEALNLFLDTLSEELEKTKKAIGDNNDNTTKKST